MLKVTFGKNKGEITVREKETGKRVGKGTGKRKEETLQWPGRRNSDGCSR